MGYDYMIIVFIFAISWPRDMTDCVVFPYSSSLAKFHDIEDVTGKDVLVTNLQE